MKLPYWYSNLRSWIKYHPNRLHIKTLGRGWVDCDEQLLHASMQILVNFIDKEKRAGIVDWDWDENHRKVAATLERLYYWWKYDPFAQDHWKMPSNEDWLKKYDIQIDPLGVIEDWIDALYMSSLDSTKESAWAKKIIKKLKKYPPKNLPYEEKQDNNEYLYYHCLNLIENEAIKRQDKALKDLVSIRGYLWT